MILIYSSKPYIGRTVIEELGSQIKETYPNHKIVVINQLSFRNLKFQYPKKLKWSDYPYIEEPQYKFNETNWNDWRPQELTEENTCISTQITPEEIQSVETIIYADDPFNTNCHNFDLFLKHFFKDKVVDIPALILLSLDCATILKSWKERKNFYEIFSQSIKVSEIKRYFNYNYNINSMGIFGYMLKDLGIDTNIHNISKYSLQLLYELRNINNQVIASNGQMRNKTHGRLISLMNQWVGTGKYKREHSYESRLGSETSSLAIIEGLVDMGLAKMTKYGNNSEVQITSLGELFLSKLHKDCLDKDLPFRYELWQNEDLEIIKPKIKEYLKKFFGRQKRKLNTIQNEENNHG